MKFEVGKSYKTRAGYKAELIADLRKFDDANKYPLVWYMSREIFGTTARGFRKFNEIEFSSKDIIEEWSEPVGVEVEIEVLDFGNGVLRADYNPQQISYGLGPAKRKFRAMLKEIVE